ncbi:MAG TPA: SurA N-terminal domain-containing protein [Burkholderiales bacterium]|nr:SurA N-terminal domain-containing protein [Burkholderiales bacterium]
MFEFVGKHKRLLQLLLALLLVPPFAFFGIQSFERALLGGSDVADVDGSKISVQEFARASELRRDQLRSALGRNFDGTALETPEARRQLLDNLIVQRVLAGYMARNRLLVTDEQVRELIALEQAFQEDGKFSRARYEALIRAQNKSERQFEAELRSELAMRQLAAGLLDSTIVSKTAAQRYAAIRGESREVAESLLPASLFVGQVKLGADAVEAYYKAHPKEFETPEALRAQYVELSQDVLLAEEPVTLDEVKAAYEASLAPKRKERLEARKKAEGLLAEARKNPAKFAELAKANSQDPGSAAQGGDLGWFGRGALVKPFEDAAFRLKVNEISALVESEFGFHIIQLTGIRKLDGGKGEERRASHILINAPAAVKEFDAARPELERDLKRQKVGKRFAELADTFNNLAYEQPDSLQPIAERFKLKPATTDWFSRATAPAPLDNPKIVAALFSDDVIRNKRNTEAVEIAPGRLIVARVLEHRPAAVRPLDAVRAEIAKKLTQEEALRLAQEAGAARLRQLEAGQGSGVTWGAARTVSRERPGSVDPRALAQIFRADTTKLPAYVGVDLAPTGYAVYRIAKVIPAPAADDAKLRASETGLTRQEARESYEAFVGALRSRSKVQINEANLQKKGDR